MNPQYAAIGAQPVTRQPVAEEVVNFAKNLADRAHSLAERLEGKLQPVMTSPTPRACGESLKDGMEYPPLFATLRGSFFGIETSLDAIEYALSRTEL